MTKVAVAVATPCSHEQGNGSDATMYESLMFAMHVAAFCGLPCIILALGVQVRW